MKKCPFCAEEIQDEAVVCRYCGRDIAPQKIDLNEKIVSPLKKEKKQPKVTSNIILVLVVIIVILCGLVWASSNVDSGNKSSSSVGSDTVDLYYGGVDILCGTTEQNYKDLIDALVDKDEFGFAEMFLDGRAFRVDSGTEALVLDRNFSTAKVRILEGPHKNDIAWVGIEALGK